MPFIAIMDKTKKIPIQQIGEPAKPPSELIVSGEEAEKLTDPSKFHYVKYKEPIFMSNMTQEIDKFLSSFLEGQHKPFLNSEKMKQKSKVMKICSDNF